MGFAVAVLFKIGVCTTDILSLNFQRFNLSCAHLSHKSPLFVCVLRLFALQSLSLSLCSGAVKTSTSQFCFILSQEICRKMCLHTADFCSFLFFLLVSAQLLLYFEMCASLSVIKFCFSGRFTNYGQSKCRKVVNDNCYQSSTPHRKISVNFALFCSLPERIVLYFVCWSFDLSFTSSFTFLAIKTSAFLQF